MSEILIACHISLVLQEFFMSVTAVVPNYNYARYIQNSLKAVLNQTHPPSQIIIVDDASTDDSVEKIEEIIQGRSDVIFLRHEKNQGVYQTIEEAVARVKTEFLFISPTDDCVMPNFVEQLLRCFQKSPTIGLSCSIPTLFAGAIPDPSAPIRDEVEIYSPEKLAEVIRSHPFWIAGNSVLYRADAFRKFGGIQSRAQLFSDWILNYSIGFTYGIGYVYQSLAAARVHPNSISSAYQRSELRLAPIFDYIMEEIENYPTCKSLFKRSGILNDLGFPIQSYIRKHSRYWDFFFPMQMRRARLKIQRAMIRMSLSKPIYRTYRYQLEENA
jgi:alpha-1,3-rhamnosyltransferase